MPRADHYNSYIIGIGIGTFIGNCIFIFGGILIARRIQDNQHVLNWVIGGIFALTALIQLWKILRKKDAIHKMENPEEVAKMLEKQMDKFEEGFEKITGSEKKNKQ
jgi:Pyruvate/2-oxoacid:ferredoxin oxidoreductase gamma subunit